MIFIEISQITIRKRFSEGPLYAVVSVVFDGVLAVHNIKAAKRPDGGCIAVMPSAEGPLGRRRDVAHPLTEEFRRRLEEKIAEKLLE